MKEETFHQINAEFSGAIKRICSCYEHNNEIANELYQEVMISIWQSLSSFKGESSLKTWVYRIAYNKSITHVSKEVKMKDHSWRPLEEVDNFISSDSFNKKMENQNQLQVIQGIIKGLTPIDKEIFILYLEGEKQGTIAAITGLGESNISTKISRIKSIISSVLRRANNE